MLKTKKQKKKNSKRTNLKFKYPRFIEERLVYSQNLTRWDFFYKERNTDKIMNCCSRSPDKASSKRTKDSQERSMEKEIRELFRLFDTNNDRSISAQELGKAMRFLGMSPTQQEVSDAMRALDVNGNGRIEFQEFYTFMQNEMGKISDGDYTHKEEVIRSAFRTFDKDGNGFIDAKELRTAMKKLGECLTDKELEDMMKQADVDGDGKINYEEFVKIWCEAT